MINSFQYFNYFSQLLFSNCLFISVGVVIFSVGVVIFSVGVVIFSVGVVICSKTS